MNMTMNVFECSVNIEMFLKVSCGDKEKENKILKHFENEIYKVLHEINNKKVEGCEKCISKLKELISDI